MFTRKIYPFRLNTNIFNLIKLTKDLLHMEKSANRNI